MCKERKPRTHGYCRISRKTQNIERQIRNIYDFCKDAKIWQEAYTGRQISRPKFDEMLKEVRTGDTIVFDSVSRMSRNSAEGTKMYFDLCKRGIHLVFLKERHIDTDAYEEAKRNAGIDINVDKNTEEGKLVSDIIEAVNRFTRAKVEADIIKAFDQSEKEVEDLRKRTSEGLQTAKEHGKQVGQKKGAKLTTAKSKTVKEIIQKHSRDFGGSLNDEDCRTLCKCARGTFYKYKKELYNSKQN